MAETETLKIPIGLDTKDAEKDAKQLSADIKSIFDSGIFKNANSQLMQMGVNLKQTAQKAEQVRNQLSLIQLPELSKAEIIKQAEILGKDLDDTLAKINKLESQGVNPLNKEYRELLDHAEAVTEQFKELQEMAATIKLHENLTQQLDALNDKQKVQLQRIHEITHKQGEQKNKLESIRKILGPIQAGFKNISQHVKQGLSHLLKWPSVLKRVASQSKTTKNSFKQMARSLLQMGLGVASIGALLHKAVSYGKEGFGNLVKELNEGTLEAQRNTDLLRAKTTQLKNALGALVAPIVNVIAPNVSNIADIVTNMINNVTMFLGALTGQKTVAIARILGAEEGAQLDTNRQKEAKAAAQAELKEAKAAEKLAAAQAKANKQLAGFDELNNQISKQDTSSDLDISDFLDDTKVLMFETVEIPNRFNDMVSTLKEMWKNANFEELGRKAGTALKNFLNNVPWTKIQENARKTGSALATLINGFVKVEGLGTSIGKTLAESLNTLVYFLQNFVHTLDWGAIGQFIADAFNGWFENIDWDAIYDTVTTGIEGLKTSLGGFIQTFHWDNLSNFASNLFNTLAGGINKLFSEDEELKKASGGKFTRWSDKLAWELGDQLSKAFSNIDWKTAGNAVGNIISTLFNAIGAFIEGLGSNSDEKKTIRQALKEFWEGISETLNLNKAGEKIVLKLAAAIAGWIAAKAAWSVVTNALKTYFTETLVRNAVVNNAISSSGSILGTLLGDAIAVAAGAEIGWKLSDYILRHTGQEELADAIQETYGSDGVVGAFNLIKDELDAVDSDFHNRVGKKLRDEANSYMAIIPEYAGGFNTFMSNVNGFSQTFSDALEETHNGFLYTQSDLDIMKDTMGLTEDEVKKLKESMLNTNTDLQQYIDLYPEFADAAAGDIKLYLDIVEEIKKGNITTKQGIDDYIKTVSDANNREIELADSVNAVLEDKLAQYTGTNEGVKILGRSLNDSTHTAKESAKQTDKAISGIKKSADTLKTIPDEAGKVGTEAVNQYTGHMSDTVYRKRNEYTKIGKEPLKYMEKGMKEEEEPANKSISNTFESFMSNIKLIFNSEEFRNLGLGAFGGLLNGFQEKGRDLWDWLTGFFDDISSIFSDIGDTISGTLSDWGEKLSNFSISDVVVNVGNRIRRRFTGYASGQVIPPNMAAHLAVLGDNNRETEVVSPLSTMKQAMIEALNEGNFGGGDGNIVIQIDGTEVFRAVRKRSQIFYNQTGISAFA